MERKNENKQKSKSFSFVTFWKTLPGFLTALAAVIGAITGLLVAIRPSTKQSPSPSQRYATNSQPQQSAEGEVSKPTCKVSGPVYDEDKLPVATGLANVNIAYIPSGQMNSRPVQIATTDPYGGFSFPCSQIKADFFPIHLQMTYSWPGGSQVIQSEDSIYVTGSPEMNLYLSPSTIANWHRTNATVRKVMPITSAKLLKHFATINTAGPKASLPTNAISILRLGVPIPKMITVTQ